MKKKPDTRTQILKAAEDLIMRQSLSGVSFQDLAKQVGIKKGSMYYHFETKDDLAIAMLNRASEKFRESFQKAENLSAKEKLDNLFSYYRTRICSQSKMCPGGIYAAEWDSLSPRVREAVKAFMSALRKELTSTLKDGVESGEFRDFGESYENIAKWIASNLQGSLIISRVEENMSSFENTERLIKSYLYKE